MTPKGGNFHDGFDLKFTENHWSNKEKCILHVEEIIVPYIELKQKKLGLNTNQKVICIFDVFKGQKIDKYKSVLDKYIISVYVPTNMTNHFQPLNMTINKVAKTFKEKLGNWYANEFTQELNGGAEVYSIKVKIQLTVLTPIQARWLISLYDHLNRQVSMML